MTSYNNYTHNSSIFQQGGTLELHQSSKHTYREMVRMFHTHDQYTIVDDKGYVHTVLIK